MPSSVPENPPVPAARPAYLPWYFHVPVMLLLMLAMLGMIVIFGIDIIFIYGMLILVAWTAICLAVAGERSRLLFSGVLVVAGVLTAVGLAFTEWTKLETGVPLGLLMFAMVPLWPAMLLWLAHTLYLGQRKL